MGENKQVRVDNWGVFFLQRLQMFFSKTDYCDLTLQFEGNVQLKVHRLVMNACTEYFEHLENSNRLIEESVILMPDQLQADVIVPIVNFMYTGMLEFPMSLFDKLYQAADIMHIAVLTKLLDAQRQPLMKTKKLQKPANSWIPAAKKSKPNIELPETLPGRKLPVWKRKTVPTPPTFFGLSHHDQRRRLASASVAVDPLSIPDNGAKPTRFEWPDDDLPSLPLEMDSSGFGDISYTSKPLLTSEDERKVGVGTFFDDSKPNMECEDENTNRHYNDYEEMLDDPPHLKDFVAGKRKIDSDNTEHHILSKRIKLIENDKEAIINVISNDNNSKLDPTKLVSEILKKYPHLVQKKKHIKLKIIAKPKDSKNDEMVVQQPTRAKITLPSIVKSNRTLTPDVSPKKTKGPWYCESCIEGNSKPMEFVLYYLYRKHMTDIHNEKFNPLVCKYCGIDFAKNELLLFHLFTRHGIKPPGDIVFPPCSLCPFIALSKAHLLHHKSKHSKAEMQCAECKLAFNSSESIGGHIQITGHMGKSKRNSYDCQYCMKTSQSANNLLYHIKNEHAAEGRRDGIVSLEDIDEDEVEEEEEEEQDEYIVPEIISNDNMQTNKVKIISDVKVALTKGPEKREVVQLEPSSEAEALSNVASGIATSLGLVDIVVLDENQQYILHNQQNEHGDQSEYILPELQENSQTVGEVITGDELIAGSQLSSTDELVMVLTDHDYQEEHGEITGDNSNIVVLYSHPVDGQQGQFITSQGNLMVNSQTGMLELRNGATITTTAGSQSQIVVSGSQDTHIETIEMIQREIDSHTGLKQEPFYEEDRKPDLVHLAADSDEHRAHGDRDSHPPIDETFADGEHIEHEIIYQDMGDGIDESAEEVVQEVDDVVDNGKVSEEVPVEPMEVDEVFDKAQEVEEDSAKTKDDVGTPDQPTDIHEESISTNSTTEPKKLDDQTNLGHDVTPDETRVLLTNPDSEGAEIQTATTDSEEEHDTIRGLGYTDNKALDDVPPEDHSSFEVECASQSAPEAMEVDGRGSESNATGGPEECNTEDEVETSPSDKAEEIQNNSANADEPVNSTTPPLREEEVNDIERVAEEKMDDNLVAEPVDPVERNVNSGETSNDENSQSSQGSQQARDRPTSQGNKPSDTAKLSILDDWDDTDSQQSDKDKSQQPNKKKSEQSNQEKPNKEDVVKGAAETVDKLIDDWEEDDDGK